ncbi:hypothetical protein NC796_03075 [Aliifodinibius sp. S!AR15-10]|uniref:hypothetical protein n=1 Tax=Aliifodinibius sp. S!AR15-10 TaxID=2950437 RepID=UPI0028558840|nr:hypothetical protein [Aliifodinibius sp. S!AR15-10]MDR8390107.1 hypothetical protein [Aliifodinibius sp. S!AR15-10]
MKKIISITILCFSLSIISETAYAQNDGLGLGAMINGPTGISYKAWFNDDMAIAGGLTFNIGDISSFYMHSDFIVHGDRDGSFDLESGIMRLYYGFGARLDYNDITNDTEVGIRFPLGTNYDFEDVPADLFFELAPTILIVDFNFGLNGALGFRYYLN